ncbi:MAG: hypothetical protein HZC14_02865, partial [Candidatus Niyogibacteria bacterium]|nr:hypothetical protein [Candidatus Niyogibacteria bacterium]
MLETASNFVTVFFEELGRALTSLAVGIKEKSASFATGVKDKFMSLITRERPQPPGNNTEPSPVLSKSEAIGDKTQSSELLRVVTPTIVLKDLDQKEPDIILQKPAPVIAEEKPSLAATPSENLTGSGLTASGGAPQPTIIQRTIERVISGITAEDLDQKLNKQEENFFAKVEGLKNQIASMGSQNFQAIALTNKIDQLTGTKLYNVTVSGMSGLTDADIPNDLTASNYLPLTGGTLTGA